MHKCNDPDHPYCTCWVAEAASICSAGHLQPDQSLTACLTQPERLAGESLAASGMGVRPGSPAPYLHLSGYDPRAAGGRQTLKVELFGVLPETIDRLVMTLRSELIQPGRSRHLFDRTARGDWMPVFIAFSSRGKEHGQYLIEGEILASQISSGQPGWVWSTVVLVPRPDATLTEIHQVFLGTHKNVRIIADDASVAKVGGVLQGAGSIDIHARNGAIADVSLLQTPGGKYDIPQGAIAWDEALLEIAPKVEVARHPHPASKGCLSLNRAGKWCRLRLFSLDEWVLGRYEPLDPKADILLAGTVLEDPDNPAMTRRISARHAVIRRVDDRFEIEDISRYGILLDGTWPGKGKSVPLELGMRIELTSSFRNIVFLQVVVLFQHALILTRIEAAESEEYYYLLKPEAGPPVRPQGTAGTLPLLFHLHGGFWLFDSSSGIASPLVPGVLPDQAKDIPPGSQFIDRPYPECMPGSENCKK